MYRKHRKHVLPDNDDTEIDNNTDLNNDKDNDLQPRADVPPSMDALLKNCKENLCSFILKCREKNHIPQVVQQEIVNDIHFLFCYFKENYDACITYHLLQNGFNVLECPELKEVIQSNDFFENASAAVRSPYMLKEHCKSKLKLVEPVHHVLRSESGHKIGTYSYVPITEVLAHYCSHKDIVDEIQANRYRDRDPDYLSDYCDGSYFKEHPFFKVYPHALRLHFYEDEFEVVNPLGSKRTKHKLCAFYYTVGNVDSKHRSKLRHIHLALLVRQTFVKCCGLQTILKPMLDDLKKS